MKIQHTYIYLFVFTALTSMSCTKKSFRYSDIQQKQISNFDSGYKEYCNLDFNSNFELNAVLCSFYGDYQNALDQATKREPFAVDPLENISHSAENKADLIHSLEAAIQNPEANKTYKAFYINK